MDIFNLNDHLSILFYGFFSIKCGRYKMKSSIEKIANWNELVCLDEGNRNWKNTNDEWSKPKFCIGFETLKYIFFCIFIIIFISNFQYPIH